MTGTILTYRTRGAPVAPYPWMTVLRSHCVTLSELAPDDVPALSVTTQLTGDDSDEVNAVRQLSQVLADEFGFTANVRINGRSVSVRFAHPAPDSSGATSVAGRKEPDA